MKHPNKIPFEGILTRLDLPSDKAPSGSKGHRVLLTTTAAREALDSLVGMAVGFTKDWKGHDPRQKCGVISDAFIDGSALCIRGYIYGRDYPDVVEALRKTDRPIGMSYELCDAHVEDMREPIWKLTRATFTGAALLFADTAAYRSTSVSLSAKAEKAVTNLWRRLLGQFELVLFERFTGKLSFEGEAAIELKTEE